LGVSEATARRDLAALVEGGRIQRTYGGAIGEFFARFPSFAERRQRHGRVKARLAKVARGLIQPGTTLYLDTGTTVYALADEIRQSGISPLNVVTPSLTAANLLAEAEGIDVFQTAGRVFPRQSVLIGELTRKSLEFWEFDIAFLSAEAMDETGIWNSHEEIVAQQRVAMGRAQKVVVMLDGSKVGRRAAHLMVRWEERFTLLTDLEAERLEEAGIRVPSERLMNVGGARPGPKRDPEGGDGLPVHYL
jgi:DeoR/GlpR family transcriptional regulator of sugar metabolism